MAWVYKNVMIGEGKRGNANVGTRYGQEIVPLHWVIEEASTGDLMFTSKQLEEHWVQCLVSTAQIKSKSKEYSDNLRAWPSSIFTLIKPQILRLRRNWCWSSQFFSHQSWHFSHYHVALVFVIAIWHYLLFCLIFSLIFGLIPSLSLLFLFILFISVCLWVFLASSCTHARTLTHRQV